MKNLIHEIHRRSLWQVLGIYLAASWIVLQVIDVLGNNFGLPEWVPPFALVLLLLGLPVVLATAFIQEGVGGSREVEIGSAREGELSRAEAPSSAASGAGTRESSRPERPSASTARAGRAAEGAHHRLFTWRNAILGGAGAFTLLGLLTATYLVMRTAGIGPAGTLVAKGVIERGAQVVLADFASADPELSEVVTGTLRIDLLQSPTIRIVDKSELAEALERMQRDPEEPITTDIARELAQREGYAAAIEGEIRTAGSSFVLSSRIVGGPEWTSLAAFRQTAEGEDDLIRAIEALSRDIRDRAGESLRTVRGGKPLEQVTTPSIEALRAYTRGEALEERGDRPGALELYERAVEVDPEFAMAYRKIGVLLGNIGIRRSDQVAALTRAYELRHRLPESERHLAEGYYHSAVSGDRDAAIRAYEGLLNNAPDNPIAHNNLGVLYRVRGRLDEAADLLSRRLTDEPHATPYTNLAEVRFMQGGYPAASATLDTAVARLPAATFVFEHWRVKSAVSAAEYELADSLAAAFAERFGRPAEAVMAAHQRFRLAAIRGRLRDAERQLADFDLSPGFEGNPIVIAVLRAELAGIRGELSQAARVVTDEHAGLRDSVAPGDRLYEMSIHVLLSVDAATEAARLLDEWTEEVPEEELGVYGRDERRHIAARLASARGEVEEAIRLFGAYERECPGECAPGAALGLARVHEARGDAPAAIREYERFLAHRHSERWWWDSSERAPAYERLGRLYEETDDHENAARYYSMFVDLWAGADPELQPRVRDAQARLERLVRARG